MEVGRLQTQSYLLDPMRNMHVRLKPVEEVLIITDGSAHLQQWGAGAAFVVVKTSPFKILGAGYEGWPWAPPFRMEVEAIRMGLKFACAAGFANIQVCSDCLPVIQILQAGSSGPPQIQDIMEDIYNRVNSLPSTTFCKVSRQCTQNSSKICSWSDDTEVDIGTA
ncbi:hypothetical protein QJS10_CPB12g00271 [Acorus calamus]|uniref:RNase H type-1 domain-containing protein n=1 Tax=Acorus calamus TaxID=4465 RepID=A0AAV9DMV1_ACOCL|nr:hypothetical protein QJS10_CPB12g00271 [Acorus calamus]